MFKYFFYHYSMLPENTVGFTLYGRLHLSWLAFLLAAGILTVNYYRRLDEGRRFRFRRGMTLLMVVMEIVKDLVLAATGNFGITYLPFHLCGIAIIVAFIQARSPRPIYAEIMYALCLPGALSALLFPNWTEYPFWNFMHMHSFVIHAMIVTYPVMLIAAKDYRPDYHNYLKVLRFIILLGLVIYGFDKLFDVNFLFINWPSEGSPLVWFAAWLGNPGYLIPYGLLLLTVMGIMYLPFYLGDRRMAVKMNIN